MFLSARQGSRPGDTAIDNKKKKRTVITEPIIHDK